jgi:hypothetical protein
MSIIVHIICLEINSKEDKMSVQGILNCYGIKSIWHFTDESNLESISRYGLLSLNDIKRQQIKVSRYGATHSSHLQDIRKGLDKFVHLAFVKDHPMYHIAKRDGRIINPVWVEIDLSAISDRNTIFSNMLANTHNAKIFNGSMLEKMIDFKTILYEDDFNIRKEARKAEIMVANQISIDKIKGFSYGN